MPTDSSGSTFEPTSAPSSRTVNQLCCFWRSWKSRICAAAWRRARAVLSSTFAMASAMAAWLTRKSSTRTPSNCSV